MENGTVSRSVSQCWYLVQCGPLHMSTFCPVNISPTSRLTLYPGSYLVLADSDWDLPKIDLATKKTLNPWALQVAGLHCNIMERSPSDILAPFQAITSTTTKPQQG